MIDYIKGILAHKGPDHMVIDCGGIGIRVLTTASSLAEIGDLATEVVCFTELIVREDAMLLVGFSGREELEVYRMLTSVSGVGTKVALTILSSMPYRMLCAAIVNKDLKALQTAKGVGRKTAELIVVELKDKLGGYAASDTGIGASDGAGGNTRFASDSDALAALIQLGYTRVEAMRALKSFDHEGMGVEAIVKSALMRLMRMS